MLDICWSRVALQLSPLSLQLAIEQRIHLGTLVPARLVVNDPW